MSTTFAEIVEDVKQLSPAEQEALHELIRKFLIEARRSEIRENADASLEEYRDGKLESFSSVDELMNSLSHD
jgi:hypothetical protein